MKRNESRGYLSFLYLGGAAGGLVKSLIETLLDYRKHISIPKWLKTGLYGLLVIVVLAIVISAILPSHAARPTIAATTPNPPTKSQLLSLVNQERARNGARPLTEDPRLDQSAQMKADDEVTYHYFGHISPHDGKHGYEYINTTGITCKADGENLTQNLAGQNTAQQAVYSWIKSPAHHAAMIDAKSTLTGFGIDGDQIVEHFCQQ